MSTQYYQFLNNVFQQLRNTPVVTAGSITPTDLMQFQDVLNTTQPKTPEDTLVVTFVRFLCAQNRQALLNYLRDTPAVAYLALISDGYCIAGILNIYNMVYINWDNVSHMFVVKEKIRQTPSTDQRVAATTTTPTYPTDTTRQPKPITKYTRKSELRENNLPIPGKYKKNNGGGYQPKIPARPKFTPIDKSDIKNIADDLPDTWSANTE